MRVYHYQYEYWGAILKKLLAKWWVFSLIYINSAQILKSITFASNDKERWIKWNWKDIWLTQSDGIRSGVLYIWAVQSRTYSTMKWVFIFDHYHHRYNLGDHIYKLYAFNSDQEREKIRNFTNKKIFNRNYFKYRLNSVNIYRIFINYQHKPFVNQGPLSANNSANEIAAVIWLVQGSHLVYYALIATLTGSVHND